MIACFEVMFGEMGIIPNLIKFDMLPALVFLILYTFLITIVLGNMFIAIIGSNYNDS
jgi:hypothetical protein